MARSPYCPICNRLNCHEEPASGSIQGRVMRFLRESPRRHERAAIAVGIRGNAFQVRQAIFQLKHRGLVSEDPTGVIAREHVAAQ